MNDIFSIVLLDWIQRNNSRQYVSMPILDYSTVSRNVFCNNNKGAWNQGNKRFEEAFTCTWCVVESTELTRKKAAISKIIPVTYSSDMPCFNGNFKVLPGREGWQSNIWLCMYQYTQNRLIWGSWHAVALTYTKIWSGNYLIIMNAIRQSCSVCQTLSLQCKPD